MALRCAHGFLGKLCVVQDCPNWDQVRCERDMKLSRCRGCGGKLGQGRVKFCGKCRAARKAQAPEAET